MKWVPAREGYWRGSWWRLASGELVWVVGAVKKGSRIHAHVRKPGGKGLLLIWSSFEKGLLPLVDVRPGEWWRFRVCPSHGRVSPIGELPFRVPESGSGAPSLTGVPTRELVSCGCLTPDEAQEDRHGLGCEGILEAAAEERRPSSGKRAAGS
jgi:hypothetical protein